MIDRRTLLRGLAVAPLAGALPALARAPRTAATDSWKDAFDRALARDRRLLGWKSPPGKRLEASALPVRGRLPRDLVGTFYRNGPAHHERAGRRYRHWFDGDGMVQAFRLDGETVDHLGRTVETAKLADEERAGRHLYLAFGTPAPEPIALRKPDQLNPANISVLHHAGELLALWEGGSAHRLDPATLATLERKIWRPDLDGVAFSAHPKVEPDGTLWNFGSEPSHGVLVLYRIDPAGGLREAATVAVEQLGMIHDFVVTRRHLVFVLPPLVYERERFGPSSSFLDVHVWRPELGTRVLVVAKDDFAERRWYELPAGFAFHFGNGWEEDDGGIRFDYCVAPDPTVMTETLRYVMRGEFRPPTAPARLAQVVLPARGAAAQTVFEPVAEFPRVAPAVVARRHGQLYLLTGGRDSVRLTAVARFDAEHGFADRFDYGERFIAEEHVFVPRPGGTGETDGWLIGTALDLAAGVTVLSVFDAARLGEGPLAQATLPYPLPLGFHGTFASA